MNTDGTLTNGCSQIRVMRLAMVCVALMSIAAAVAWHFDLVPGLQPRTRENAIMVIAPYRDQGTWVFDDSSAGL